MASCKTCADGRNQVEDEINFPSLFSVLSSTKRVLVIGDLILDQYVYGQCDHMTPDSSVPIFVEQTEEYQLGGAGNVVKNLSAMGISVDLLTICGVADDIISGMLSSNMISANFVLRSKSFRVKTLKRYISRNRQFLRVDSHINQVLCSDDVNSLTELYQSAIESVKYDVILLSDYRNGIFTKTFSQFIISLARERSIPTIVDPKRGEYERFSGATYIKPNKADVFYFLDKSVPTKENTKQICQEFCKQLNVPFCILTLAEDGIACYSSNGDFQTIQTNNTAVVTDVCGAGDTTVAALTFGIANNWSLKHSCNFANACAANVIAKYGTIPVEIIDVIPEKVIRSRKELGALKAFIPRDKTTVLTTGCFDLLHAGHIDSLNKASKVGDILFVALNTDESIKKNKGPLRPIIPLKQRLEMLQALHVVNFIVIFDDKRPDWVVETLDPDVFVKGEDYSEKQLRKSFPSLKRIEIISFQQEASTSGIIQKVQNTNNIK